MNLSDLFIGIGKPAAYYPSLARVIGLKGSIFVCNLCWWTGHQSDNDGWIYKSREEFSDETGLSFDEQRTAIKVLKAKKLIEVKEARLEHRTYYRVNLVSFNELESFFESKPVDVSACECPKSGSPTSRDRDPRRRDVGIPDAGTLGSPTPSIIPGTLTGTTVPDTTQGVLISPATDEDCGLVYDAYPKKVGRPKAIAQIKKAIDKHGLHYLFERTKLYASSRAGHDPQYTPHPATWFGQERFLDDPSTWAGKEKTFVQKAMEQGGETFEVPDLTCR